MGAIFVSFGSCEASFQLVKDENLNNQRIWFHGIISILAFFVRTNETNGRRVSFSSRFDRAAP